MYYLGIIKQVFFDKVKYTINPYLTNKNLYGYLIGGRGRISLRNIAGYTQYATTYSMAKQIVIFKPENISLSSSLTITISILSLIILLFIFMSKP